MSMVACSEPTVPTARLADRMNAAQKTAASKREEQPAHADGAARLRQKGDACRREQHPEAVEQPARTGHGDAEGPEKLDGDHDADRGPADRLVETEVHRQQAEGEREEGKPVALSQEDGPGGAGQPPVSARPGPCAATTPPRHRRSR